MRLARYSVEYSLAFIASLTLAHGPDGPQHRIADLGKFEFEGGGSIGETIRGFLSELKSQKTSAAR